MEIPHRFHCPLVFAVALALGTIILATLHTNFPPNSRAKHTMTEPSFLANLQLHIAQSTVLPRSISVSVRNRHPSIPVTILKWNSPLDPAALGLGLVRITATGTTEPFHIDAIKIRRLMPPKAESLVTLMPGDSTTSTVELREPIVPQGLFDAGPARVMMKGRWMAVWPEMTKEDLLLNTKRLQSVGAGVGSLIGDWESECVEVS